MIAPWVLRWIEFLAGLLLLLVVFWDVFTTVVVPRPSSRGIRFGPLLGRSLAPLWELGARITPSARLRQGIRGGLGPFILVLSLIAWVAALAVGFALILYSEPGHVHLQGSSFSEALFQATLALSTLGIVHTDVSGSARWVVAVAGIAGFAIVSLVAAFLLAIQGALHRREVLVLTLAARAGRPPSAIRLIESAAEHGEEGLADLFGRWELWAADVMQSHLSYPVLCRFRSLDENMEWLLCLSVLLEGAALVQAFAPDRFAHARHTAGFLLRTGSRATRELVRVIGVRPQPTTVEIDEFLAIRRHFEARGLAAADDAATEHARHAAARVGFAPALRALAARLDIIWPDATLKPVDDGWADLPPEPRPRRRPRLSRAAAR